MTPRTLLLLAFLAAGPAPSSFATDRAVPRVELGDLKPVTGVELQTAAQLGISPEALRPQGIEAAASALPTLPTALVGTDLNLAQSAVLPTPTAPAQNYLLAALLARHSAEIKEAFEVKDAPPALPDAHIGADDLRAVGFKPARWQLEEISRLEDGVARFNATYLEGYHGASHQVGKGSVADLAVRTALVGLKRPEGMSQSTFEDVAVKFYMAALIHDVEGVPVMVMKDGRTFRMDTDSTKVNPVDISALGEPVERRLMKDGSELRIYPKAPDSRSSLRTTLNTIRLSQHLAPADHPLIKYFALRGTAFSPEEKALWQKRHQDLDAQIRRRYGKEGAAVIALADSLSDKLGVADVMDHYVRETAAALHASKSLEKEFQQPKIVNTKGAFGFFEFVLTKDAVFTANYPSLPVAERARFARNLAAFRLIQLEPALLDESVEKIAADPRLDALMRLHPDWPDLPFVELIAAVKKALPN